VVSRPVHERRQRSLNEPLGAATSGVSVTPFRSLFARNVMSSRAELILHLGKHSRIIVTGPQRSGTTISAQIIADELNYTLFPEEEIGVSSLHRFFSRWYSTTHCRMAIVGTIAPV
jgi:hypothetical protein